MQLRLIFFNKIQLITTLVNDSSSSKFTFPIQKNVLYKGKASVTKGRFKYEFIVPKDIGYQYGIGRISYYGEDGKVDAK